jgi:hypothetical protein
MKLMMPKYLVIRDGKKLYLGPDDLTPEESIEICKKMDSGGYETEGNKHLRREAQATAFHEESDK